MSKSKPKLNLTLALCAAANLLLNAPEIRFLTLGGNEVCKLTPTEGALEEMHVYPENRLVELQQMERWFGELREDLRTEYKFMIKRDGPENVFISVTKLLPFYKQPLINVYLEDDVRIESRIGESLYGVMGRLEQESEPKSLTELAQENPDKVLRLMPVHTEPAKLHYLCYGPLVIIIERLNHRVPIQDNSLREAFESCKTLQEVFESKKIFHIDSILSFAVLSISPDVKNNFIMGLPTNIFQGTAPLPKDVVDLVEESRKVADDAIARFAQVQAAAADAEAGIAPADV